MGEHWPVSSWCSLLCDWSVRYILRTSKLSSSLFPFLPDFLERTDVFGNSSSAQGLTAGWCWAWLGSQGEWWCCLLQLLLFCFCFVLGFVLCPNPGPGQLCCWFEMQLGAGGVLLAGLLPFRSCRLSQYCLLFSLPYSHAKDGTLFSCSLKKVGWECYLLLRKPKSTWGVESWR